MALGLKMEAESERPSFREEWSEVWAGMPNKAPFVLLFVGWLALFHWLGNSTLGYVNTPSLFGWLHYAYQNSQDDEHGYLIPVVVAGLLWWKRRLLLDIPKRHWWPALGLILAGLFLHIVGYVVQQTRVSVVGFFVGLYGLTGLVWGPSWLRGSFFPFFLFGFCVPLATLSEPLTFPLRVAATAVTGWINQGVLGISVICDGTRIYDPNGSYQYEVAAACSGIRSMTATLAVSLIYAFVGLNRGWTRAVLILSSGPLAVVANVVRLCMIIIASEAFGREAGEFVHSSSWMSLLPYLPALGGVMVLGNWLRRRDPEVARSGRAVPQPA